MQSSKQTPSVIARLMGLDDLPSQPPQPSSYKRQRVLSENYLRKTASIGQWEKSILYSGRSYRAANNQRGSKNGVEEEITVTDRNSLWSVSDKKVNSDSISANIFSSKPSGVAKHPLIDKKLHRLKEFDNVMEDLHFNQGKQSRYLQQADLLPKKQLKGQQSHEPHFSGHSKELDSFSAHNNRKNRFCNNSNKATIPRCILRSLQKLENDLLSGPGGKFQINNLHKLLIFKSDLKDKTQLSPTRIIVLKPTSRNALNSARCSSLIGASGAFLSGDGKKADLLIAEKGEENSETTGKEGTDKMECSRQDNRVLKNINKRIADESWLFTPPCQSVNNWDKVGWKPCSASGSGLAMGAKKQILGRWKTTKIFEEGNVASKRSTPGEMLDVSDKETNPLCNKLDKGSSFSLLSQQNGQLISVNRFGITSKIGGKVEKRISPLSKLHLHKFKARNGASHSGELLRREEADGMELSKTRNQKGNLEPRESIINLEKPQFPPNLNLENQNIQEDGVIFKSSSSCNACIDTDNGQPSKVSQVIKDEMESSFSRDDMSGDTAYSSDVLNSPIGRPSSCVAEVESTDGQSSDVDISFSEFTELQFEPMLISLVKDDDAVQVWKTSSRQTSSDDFDVEGFGFSSSTRSGRVLHKNLRENNQQSPNSVLDPPFPEENVHTFQGFAAADLYSLARRLQLQKSKSEETYSEGTEMDVSSDEGTERGYDDFSQDTGKMLEGFHVEESRNFSYLVDVLDEAGFSVVNLEIGFRTWNSVEYPVSHSVFEALEKKYGKQTSWEKSERRLLFDRINAGLKEILNFDITLWAKPLSKRFSAALRRDEIEEELWTLLTSEEKQADKDLSEKALGMETKWLQLSEGIHDICRDVVNDLFDELVGELAGIEGS